MAPKAKRKWKPGAKVPAPTFPRAAVSFTGILLTICDGLEPQFSGASYEPAKDQARLTTNLQRVYDLMKAGEWWTVPELADHLAPGGVMAQTGISARLRDLRKPKFGAYNIESRRRGGSGGLWEYRLVL